MHIGFRQLLPLLLILILVQCMGCSVAHRQAAQQDPFIALRMSGLSAGSPEQGDFDAEYNDEDGQMIADPLKPWNVVWFYFNDAFYQVVRPTAVAYNYVVPEPARKGVDNFFYNAKFPIRFVNCLLQGKLLAAGVEFSRFFGNTLFGGLGFMDITEYKKAAAPTPPEDFGQTLGVWGVDNGFYLVLPIFGPSTLRDGVGMGVDYFLDPLTYLDPWFLNWHADWWIPTWVSATRGFTNVAREVKTIDALNESAVDRYSAFRNAYVQSRMKMVSE